MTRSAGASHVVLLLAAVSAACQGGGGPTSSPNTATLEPTVLSTPFATAASPAPEPTAAEVPTVLEDAGKEVHLRAGTYVSRLFAPGLKLELGPGWYLRDDPTVAAVSLRHGDNVAASLTFRAGTDFLQCGTGDVMTRPTLQEAAPAILGMRELDIEPLEEASVGGRMGVVIRLRGTGTPLTEAQILTNANEFGCVFSSGAEAYPSGNSGWSIFDRSTIAQLVLVDVDGSLVIVVARPDDNPGAPEPSVYFDFVLKVLETTQLG